MEGRPFDHAVRVEPARGVSRRRPRTAVWAAAGVGIVMVALVGVLATRPSAEMALARSPLRGKPAPEVSGPGLDGSTVRLSDLRGRYVVLNFFASWCIPCQREHPELLAFSQRHRALGDATVLAVAFDDDAASARSFFADRGGDWPVVLDPSGKVALDYGVRGPPESYLIDPEGFVLTKIVGQVRARGLDDLLRRAKAARA